MRPKYILISGKAGSGKTAAAKYLMFSLLGKGYSVAVDSFARNLKDIALQMGWDGEKDLEGRRLLQNLGRVGREYDINTWVKFVLRRNVNPDFVIVDDWRFKNEGHYLIDNGVDVYFIRVHGRAYQMDDRLLNDASETELPNDHYHALYDYAVDNRYSLEDLREEMESLAERIYNGEIYF